MKEIVTRLRSSGYDVRTAIADIIGAAWAISRLGQVTPIIESGEQAQAFLNLPAAALRLKPDVLIRLRKLGLYTMYGNNTSQPL